MDTPPTTEESDAGLTVLEQAFIEYRDAGLLLPPVPRELLEELDSFIGWQWGSDQINLESVDDFLARTRDSATETEICFGHAGHGVQSWFLYYRLILPALAVFVRHPYGGVYGDKEFEAAVANGTVAKLQDLVVAAAAAAVAGLIPAGQRLVVVLDSKGGSGWEVTGDDIGWRQTTTPIEDALAFCGD